MATPQKGESSGIIGAISKFAGAAVGTAVITGKRIVGSATPPSKGTSGKATRRAPAKIKKKVVKRKPAGSSGKSAASKKKPVQSPAKKKKGATPRKKTTKKKGATPRKKTTRRKTKKTASANVSSKKSTEKKGTTKSQKSSIPIIEYNGKANKAVVPATSVL
jgi:hypothetical protein